jgi:hypothetical protein
MSDSNNAQESFSEDDNNNEGQEELGEKPEQESLVPKIDIETQKKIQRKLRRKERKSRPNIRVTVHFNGNEGSKSKNDHDQVILVNCGTGEQSIRWLAQVASLQLTKKARPSGHQRQRDVKLKIRGNLLPKSVLLTPRGNLQELLVEVPEDQHAPIHPKAKIIDVLKDGAHVRLSVQNEIKPTKALLPKGAVYERPSWTEVAFTNSNDGVRRSSIRQDVSPMRMSSHGSPDRKVYEQKIKLEKEMEIMSL